MKESTYSLQPVEEDTVRVSTAEYLRNEKAYFCNERTSLEDETIPFLTEAVARRKISPGAVLIVENELDLRHFFAEPLPSHSGETRTRYRIHRMSRWFNLLISSGVTTLWASLFFSF